MMNRYLPSKELPPYAFLPGQNPHPEKAGGHMEGQEVEAEKLTEENFSHNIAYLYGLDLFNHGYFWESHVWWEELWNLAGRRGESADFLKALIKLAAAGVKAGLNQDQVSLGHLDRALELLIPLLDKKTYFFGMDLKQLIEKIEALKEEPQFSAFKLELQL